MTEKREIKREARIAEIYHSKLETGAGKGVNTGDGGDRIIAGDDDRTDIFELDESDAAQALQKRLADSTVILTDKSRLSRQPDGSYKLTVEPFRRAGLPACGGEKFGNQHTGGWCSGFMVGPDIVVTAGHCGETEQEIQNTAYVFGFRVASDGDPGTTEFRADQVYFGSELLAHDLSPTGDFAIVRVDRRITAPGAEALKVRTEGAPGLGTNLGVIGYPSGLPVKVAFGDSTVLIRDDDPWLIANLDTFGGNSGSPVFNSDGLVEGILVRGARDYNINSQQACFEVNRIADSEGSEASTKASAWVDKIPTD